MDELMYEIFGDLPRQGPGDRETTRRALELATGLPDRPDILDVGCGCGGQTLDLADLTAGRITAVDNYAPYLARLEQRAAATGLAGAIRTVRGDMAALELPEGSFDLIWSEGAAYNMGFARALTGWRPLLRPAGCLAVSELVWFTRTPAPEAQEYWAREWPDIKHFEDNFPAIEAAGYRLSGYFPLPERSWWTNLYGPLERKLVALREQHRGNAAAGDLLDSLQLEIDICRRHADAFGYGFYVMKRVERTD